MLTKAGWKSGGRFSCRAAERTMAWSRLSMVRMLRLARSRRMTSSQRAAMSGVRGMPFSGVPRAMALRRLMTRSRISPAAALVKVMARISSQPEGPVPSPQEAAAAGAGAPQAASRHKKRRVRS